MAKKKKTIKSELEALDRERMQEQVVAPVASTDYTGVSGVVDPAYEAGYAAGEAAIDAAVAESPLFGGSTGAVGEKVRERAMQQGLNPAVAPVAGQNVPVEDVPVEAPVQNPVEVPVAAPVENTQAGAKVRAKAMRNGLYGPRTGEVGEDAALRAQALGLQPVVDGGEMAPGAVQSAGNWDDVFAPRIAELEAQQKQEQELDAYMTQRENSRKRIAALGDVFASFANLIGAGNNGGNDRMVYSNPVVSETIEKARNIRRTRGQQIQNKLDAQRNAYLTYQINNDPNSIKNRQSQERINNTANQQKLGWARLAQQTAHQQNQDDLDRDKFGYQQEKDARSFGLSEQRAKDASARGWANYNLSKDRFNYQKDKDARGGASGGSGGGWSKDAEANYNAFKTEIAQRANFNTWEEYAKEARKTADGRQFVDRVEGASSSPNAQRGILNSYAEQYAPDFWEKYYIKEEKQMSAPSSGKKPNPMGSSEKKKKANPMN